MKKISVRVAALLASGITGPGCANHSGVHYDGGKVDAECGAAGAATGCGGEAGYYDVGVDSTGGEPDSAVDTSIVGNCTTADDCIAVLDYRNGFQCWWPSGASRADVSSDPCLIPWTPNPECTTPAPPPGCPSGLQPVSHSCIVYSLSLIHI